MGKKKKILKITLGGIVACILLFFLTGNGELLLFIHPVKVTCPGTVEMGIGASKEVLLTINKGFTLLHWNNIDVEAGVLHDGRFEELPEAITIHLTSSPSSIVGPIGPNQDTEITVSASPDIEPGNYEICLKMSASLFGEIKTIPLTLVIHESNDDVIVTPEGPVYRSTLEGTGGVFAPVEETTVELGENQLPFTCRDSIEMPLGGYEAIIVKFGTVDSYPPAGTYTFSIIDEDDEVKTSVRDAFEVEDVQVIADGRKPVIAVLPIKSRFGWAIPYRFLIEVQEASQVIGYVPLTIDLVKSPDDIIVTPGGDGYRSYSEVDLHTYSIP